MSTPGVAYLAIACTDPARVAEVFEHVLAMPRADRAIAGGPPVPLFALGRAALALFEPDDARLDGPAATGLRHLALASDAPGAAARALSLPGTSVAGEFRVAEQAGAGVRLRFAPVPADLTRTPGPVVERIDHVGVASADNQAAHALFVTRLGCALESSQTDVEIRLAVESFTSDRYGVVHHSRAPVPVGGLRVSFITVGDHELEFLQPLDPAPGAGEAGASLGAAPGNTGGDRGAIGRYLDRRGPGLHHVALKTPDIDAALARVQAAGLRVIDRTGRPGSRRARIGFVHPGALGGVLLHFVERTPL